MTATATLAAPATVTADLHDTVLRWMPLARALAFEFLARAPRHADRDDITSAAFLGLVEAAHRYDPEAGVPFDKWARIRIRGAIVDAARASDPLTRKVRSTVRAVHAAEDDLVQERQSSGVDDVVLAHRLGLPVAEIRNARTQFRQALAVSLDELRGDDESDTYSVTLIAADPTPLESMERRELDRYMSDAVQTLPDRLRDVIESYYLGAETSAQTAERLGLTEQRIGQLRNEALQLMRDGIGAQYRDVYDATRQQTTDPAAAETAAVRRHRAKLATYASAIAARRSYAQRLSL